MSKGERRKLRDRDGGLCCPHTGGCGLTITLKGSNIDHIIPQSYCKSEGIDDYSGVWNKQLSHPQCNNTKAGRVSGITLFACLCHYFQVEQGGHLYLYFDHESRESVERVMLRQNFVQGSNQTERSKHGQPSMRVSFAVDDPSLPADRRNFSVESTMSVEMPGVPQVGSRVTTKPNAERAGFFLQMINALDVPLFNVYQRKPRYVHDGLGYGYPESRNARSRSTLWHKEIRAMFPPHMTDVLDVRC